MSHIIEPLMNRFFVVPFLIKETNKLIAVLIEYICRMYCCVTLHNLRRQSRNRCCQCLKG